MPSSWSEVFAKSIAINITTTSLLSLSSPPHRFCPQCPWETWWLPTALPNHQECQPTHHQGHLWGEIDAGDNGDDGYDDEDVEDDDFENCQHTHHQGHLWGDDDVDAGDKGDDGEDDEDDDFENCQLSDHEGYLRGDDKWSKDDNDDSENKAG